MAAISISAAIILPFLADGTAIKIVAVLTGVFTIALIFVAQYKLWRTEVRGREADQAKYVLAMARAESELLQLRMEPAIRGEAFRFTAGIYREGQNGHGHSNRNAQSFTFHLELCNLRPVTTNIRRIELDASGLHLLISLNCGDITKPVHPFFDPPDLTLEHGIAREFVIHGFATTEGISLSEVRPIDLAPLKIIVVDGFGNRHPIRVKAGEKLVFPRQPQNGLAPGVI